MVNHKNKNGEIMSHSYRWLVVLALMIVSAEWSLRKSPTNVAVVKKSVESYLAIVDLDPSVFDFNPDEEDKKEEPKDSKLSGIKFISFENLPEDGEIAMNDEPIKILHEMNEGQHKNLFIPHRPIVWWWDSEGKMHLRLAMKPMTLTKIHASPYIVEIPAYHHTDGRLSMLR